MKKVVIVLAALMMLFASSLMFTSIEKTYWKYTDSNTEMHYIFDSGEAYYVLADYIAFPVSSLWNDYVLYYRGFCFITLHSDQGDYGFLVSIFYGEKGFAAELGWYIDKPFFEIYTIEKIGNIEGVKHKSFQTPFGEGYDFI